MKRGYLVGVMVVLSCVGGATSAEETTNWVSFSHACNVDTGLVGSVSAHVSRHFGTTLKAKACLNVATASLGEVAQAAYNALEDRDVVGLVLHDSPTDENVRTILTVKDRVVLVNVRTLTRGNPELETSDGRFVRRVQKESMRAVAWLLGLRDCPTITCALYQHGDETHLDLKGVNLCPPHRRQADTKLRERKVTVKSAKEQAMEAGGILQVE